MVFSCTMASWIGEEKSTEKFLVSALREGDLCLFHKMHFRLKSLEFRFPAEGNAMNDAPSWLGFCAGAVPASGSLRCVFFFEESTEDSSTTPTSRKASST
jgi:hypothetical protein